MPHTAHSASHAVDVTPAAPPPLTPATPRPRRLNAHHSTLLHSTSQESFALQSHTFVDLWDAAFSDSERYTVREMRNLVKYAHKRGVMVLPEFDAPSHSQGMCAGAPDNVCMPSNSKCTSGSNIPLRPVSLGSDGTELPTFRYTIMRHAAATIPSLSVTTSSKFYSSPPTIQSDETFEFLSKLWKEMVSTDGPNDANPTTTNQVFPMDWAHVGGDEVSTSCWSADNVTSLWMEDKGYNESETYTYFVNKHAGE